MSFPDIIGDVLEIAPFVITEQAKVGENVYDRFRKWLRPRYVFDLLFTQLNDTDAQSIDDHVLAQNGPGVVFDWFFWEMFHWMWMPLGIGDGVTTLFTIPGKSTTDQQFYTGAATLVSGTVSVGTGAQGEDKVTLSSAPALGVNIWANFSGRRRFTCYYGSDAQPLSRQLDPQTWNFQTHLVQVK